MVDQAEWKQVFEEIGVLWRHDGNPQRPHAELTSGLHSNGFFNGSKLLKDPLILGEAISDLADLLSEVMERANFPDWVFGPPYGANIPANYLAGRLSIRLNTTIQAGFTEFVPDWESRTVIQQLKRFEVLEGELILPFEDVVTTGGSVGEMIKVLQAGSARISPWITCFLNRSGQKEIGGREIYALLTLPMDNWEPEVCPLCREGSNALRPKANWDLLTK